jgi:hypothetical protein
MASTKTVTFPKWPTWNFHFPELDVWEIKAVRFFDHHNEEQSLPLEKVRLAIGRDGTSGIVFKEKHSLPPTAERADAVSIDYEFDPAEQPA